MFAFKQLKNFTFCSVDDGFYGRSDPLHVGIKLFLDQHPVDTQLVTEKQATIILNILVYVRSRTMTYACDLLDYDFCL